MVTVDFKQRCQNNPMQKGLSLQQMLQMIPEQQGIHATHTHTHPSTDIPQTSNLIIDLKVKPIKFLEVNIKRISGQRLGKNFSDIILKNMNHKRKKMIKI